MECLVNKMFDQRHGAFKSLEGKCKGKVNDEQAANQASEKRRTQQSIMYRKIFAGARKWCATYAACASYFGKTPHDKGPVHTSVTQISAPIPPPEEPGASAPATSPLDLQARAGCMAAVD